GHLRSAPSSPRTHSPPSPRQPPPAPGPASCSGPSERWMLFPRQGHKIACGPRARPELTGPAGPAAAAGPFSRARQRSSSPPPRSAPGGSRRPRLGPADLDWEVMAEIGLIRTPDQRVRVFVSSSLQELGPERRAVRDAIAGLRLVPVMFELGARPHPPPHVYRAFLAPRQGFLGLYLPSHGLGAPGGS